MHEELKTASKLFFPEVTDSQLNKVEKSGNFVGGRINEILEYISKFEDKLLAGAIFASCFSALLQNFSVEEQKIFLKDFITRIDKLENDHLSLKDLAFRLKEEKKL